MEQTPASPQSTEQQPPQNPQVPAATASSAIPSVSPSLPPPVSTASSTNPSFTPSPKPSIAQTRPQFNTRPWQQPPYTHFSVPSSPVPSSSSPASPVIPSPPPPRDGIAIGFPAHHPSTPAPPPPASFSSLTPPSFGQQSQIMQPMQGIGMTGTLGTTSSMRPGGITAQQLRPSQSSLRPLTSPTSQSLASQSFQGHGMLRGSTLGPPAVSPSPSSSQGTQGQNQPWLSSGGKPPLPTPSTRPQTSTQSFQQRSHIPQHNTPTPQQQSPVTSSQQSAQPLTSGQPLESYSQQVPSPRIQQPLSHQQQITRGPGLGSQRPHLGSTASGALHPGAVASKTATVETEEASDRIVRKRIIQELVNQIDPSEKLDPEVEDALMEIAEDFIESITTFGCSLAKRRKSTTLEAKDILLHLEMYWNMTLPGFGGDEMKTYKKPNVSDTHKERLAAVRRSIVATDATARSSGGSSGGNMKGHLAKGPASLIGSPPPNSK